ncbi:MAG: ribosome small subunit-dependent GTPase A, partial [Leptospiraceae bacterium]|nr:ribosome small subunit-dependent GTPase A [Leptospiraceae bacterium]
MSKTQEGIISLVYGAYYNVRPLPDLQPELRAKLRGRLRLQSRHKKGSRPPGEDPLKERHLIMVGDRVRFLREHNNAIIEEVLERRNAVQRATQYEIQALGANLDRAVLVASLSTPPLRTGFIDRFLVSCHAGKVQPVLLFTKPDLVDELDEEDLHAVLTEYNRFYPVYCANLIASEAVSSIEWTAEFPGLSELTALLDRGVSLLCGQSGTGKSTLLNRLLNSSAQKIGDISSSTGKGKHTTTNAALFIREDSAHDCLLIDTPGVREWGVQHLSREEILAGFPEIARVSEDCHFADCTHASGSLQCAVQDLMQTVYAGES